MSEGGYKIRNKDGIHFITFAVVGWVDVFTRKVYRDIVLESLKYCQKEKGMSLHAWCLMSNHIHLILSAKENNTSEILRDFKKFTSKQIICCIKRHPSESRRDWMLRIFEKAGNENSRNTNYQFWQQDNHPMELYGEKFILQKLNYIHYNPVKAGIVEIADHFIYSSARNYSRAGTGLIEIEKI
ncbi:MAG: transposase [Bacteroidia bacterium]|jgi:REP element-mobilizing transposase RayT